MPLLRVRGPILRAQPAWSLELWEGGWPMDSHSLPSWQDYPVHQTQSLVPEGGL